MFLSTAVKYFLLTIAISKSSILSALEYRYSFFMQVVGMIVNDIFLLVLWIIFFQKFPSVNGWQYKDTVLLLAIGTTGCGLMLIFARGALELARTITKGELDYFLALPKNVLWHASVSKTSISAIGDTIFGLLLFFIACDVTLKSFTLFISVSMIVAVAFYNFTVITHSLAFFFGNFEDAAEQIFHALLGFTLYPQTVFTGALKIIMFTVLPAFFVATLPVRIVQNFTLVNFLALLAFTIFSFLLANFVFQQGLKRYESGNLINLRV